MQRSSGKWLTYVISTRLCRRLDEASQPEMVLKQALVDRGVARRHL